MANFAQLMRKREGVKREVYLDPLKIPTVGIGHTVTKDDNLNVGDKITQQQVAAFFKQDGADAIAAAKRQAGKAGIKDTTFIVYLASVNFQLGVDWHKKLRKCWKSILDGEYEEAAASLQKTRWFRLTPVRVKDFQRALRSLPPKTGEAEIDDEA